MDIGAGTRLKKKVPEKHRYGAIDNARTTTHNSLTQRLTTGTTIKTIHIGDNVNISINININSRTNEEAFFFLWSTTTCWNQGLRTTGWAAYERSGIWSDLHKPSPGPASGYCQVSSLQLFVLFVLLLSLSHSSPSSHLIPHSLRPFYVWLYPVTKKIANIPADSSIL